MAKIVIGSDHAAFNEKEELKQYLEGRFEVIDVGTHSADSVHYPDYGKKIAQKVLDESILGIALCGSGIGISIQVNRYNGIRGALCRSVEDAKMCKLHNNANVLCLGGRSNSLYELKIMVDTWLETQFEGGRHQLRIDLLDKK